MGCVDLKNTSITNDIGPLMLEKERRSDTIVSENVATASVFGKICAISICQKFGPYSHLLQTRLYGSIERQWMIQLTMDELILVLPWPMCEDNQLIDDG